jgi:hypothetical protein
MIIKYGDSKNNAQHNKTNFWKKKRKMPEKAQDYLIHHSSHTHSVNIYSWKARLVLSTVQTISCVAMYLLHACIMTSEWNHKLNIFY